MYRTLAKVPDTATIRACFVSSKKRWRVHALSAVPGLTRRLRGQLSGARARGARRVHAPLVPCFVSLRISLRTLGNYDSSTSKSASPVCNKYRNPIALGMPLGANKVETSACEFMTSDCVCFLVCELANACKTQAQYQLNTSGNCHEPRRNTRFFLLAQACDLSSVAILWFLFPPGHIPRR